MTTPNRNNGTANAPKAYINWILFDENFKYVDGNFDRVGSANSVKSHSLINVPLSSNGFLYVYVSNESPVKVFFDNLQVIHTRGPLLEETHYYPFGLTMAGISSKAAGSIQNKFKFNGGNELQSQEFSDGSGLETYDARHRMFDPQTGKFLQIDPLSAIAYEFSPFAFSNNNPICLNDPLGLSASTPGVNPDDKNDNAILPEVVVSNKPKPSSGGLRGFHWPQYKKQDVKTWNNAQYLYNSRRDGNQNPIQGGENDYYKTHQKYLERIYQNEQDYRKMSLGAVAIMAAPIVAVGVAETGAGATIGQGLKWVLKPRLGASVSGATADAVAQLIMKGKIENKTSIVTNFAFGNPLWAGFVGALGGQGGGFENGIFNSSYLQSGVYGTIGNAFGATPGFVGGQFGFKVGFGSEFTTNLFGNTATGILNGDFFPPPEIENK